jgi:tetratricopeptide (TPR) repeat protein
LRAGRIADARRQAEQALAVDGADPEAHFILGRVDEAEGKFADALKRFDRVLKEAPDDVAALLASGEVARRSAAAATAANDEAGAVAARTEALVRYRRAAMVRRDVFAAHLALAELEAEAGDDEAAAAHLSAARRLDDLRRDEPRPDYEKRLAILYERLAAKARAASR